MPENSRAFQKIQDGCGLFCAYCAISHARGPSRSAKVQDVIEQAKCFVANGYQEIVLVGVNLALYRDGEEGLAELVARLKQIEGLNILRLSSLEPFYVTDKLIDELADSSVVAPHFHFPLQSGSDAILKAMGRPYLSAYFSSLIHKVVAQIPDAAIGLDVIVGFPGETEEDFLQTYKFLNELDVSYLHVFTYSERDNTTALRIKEVVPVEERKRRNKMLTILSEKKKRHFYEQQKGKTFTVLFEQENHDGFISGFTENYIRVKTEFDDALANQLVKIKTQEMASDGVYISTAAAPVLTN